MILTRIRMTQYQWWCWTCRYENKLLIRKHSHHNIKKVKFCNEGKSYRLFMVTSPLSEKLTGKKFPYFPQFVLTGQHIIKASHHILTRFCGKGHFSHPVRVLDSLSCISFFWSHFIVFLYWYYLKAEETDAAEPAKFLSAALLRCSVRKLNS